jgi:hypothetical protein
LFPVEPQEKPEPELADHAPKQDIPETDNQEQNKEENGPGMCLMLTDLRLEVLV